MPTTLINASVTVVPQYTTTFNWTIDKSVTPDTWDFTGGGSGTSTYTIVVTKGPGVDAAAISGIISVTNGGADATQNLAINLDLEVNPGGGFIPLIIGQAVNVSGNPVLDPGETGNYPYLINLTPAQIFPGATYRVTAHITITNHAGHEGVPFGPNPSGTAVFPLVRQLVHDTISVTDTNGEFFPNINTTQTLTYTKTFSCSDAGINTNTATIVYPDGTNGPSDSASVTVVCRSRGLNFMAVDTK
jgi:hypothetical protein